MTALHIAARNGHRSCTKLLLERGADYRLLNFQRMTGLHDAALHGFGGIVQVFMAQRGTSGQIWNSVPCGTQD